MDISLMKKNFADTLEIQYLHSQKYEDADFEVKSLAKILAQICLTDETTVLEVLDEEFCMSLLHRTGLNAHKTLTVEIPEKLRPLCKNVSNLEHTGLQRYVSIVGPKLRVDPKIWTEWRKHTAQKGLKTIRMVLQSKKIVVKHVLLFGELSQYAYILNATKQEFDSIIVPKEDQVARIRGACIHGHHPEVLQTRIIKSSANFLVKEVVSKAPLVVAAFDFGTTFSGYAYAYRNSPLELWLNKQWTLGTSLSVKAPTCILLNSEKEFDSFGYEAETKYSDLAEEDKHHDWMLFRRFKMLLHDKEDLNRQTILEDISGKKMPAIEIFSITLSHLRNELIKRVNLSKTGMEDSDITCVLTVPAIWNDAAKQFMREAATKAGFTEDQIKLALEPEAAAMYCKNIATNIRETVNRPGTQFMVVDLGGGTVDISVQEIQTGGCIKHIHRARGGPWGGTQVDNNFLKWLTNLCGEDVMWKLKKEYMASYLELLNEFEVKKRNVIPGSQEKIIIKIPVIIFSILEKIKGTTPEQMIASQNLSNEMSFVKDKMKISASVFNSWFDEPIRQTICHVAEILEEPYLRNVKTVMLVGGFAECSLLQNAFKSAFKQKDIIIPEDAGAAVLKGAVQFGLKPTVITKRVMKMSYGLAKCISFDPAVHEKSKVETNAQGKSFVRVFDQFVAKDSEIDVGEAVTKAVIPTDSLATKIEIYSSSKANPKYIDEGSKKVGEITVEHPEGQTMYDKMFRVQLEFAETEIIVNVERNYDGKVTRSRIDFL